MRKLALAAVAAAVFLITPYFLFEAFSCQFGEAEMRKAVEGTWAVEIAPREGAPRSILLEIEQARKAKASAGAPGAPAGNDARAGQGRGRGLIRSAEACGHRSFVRSAEACLDSSELALTLTARGPDRPAQLSGTFLVVGKTFEQGGLTFQLDGILVEARISSAGEVLAVSAADGAKVSLARVSPAVARP